MKKTVIALAVIIGCLIYFGVAYSQTSAQGGEGGKSGAAGSSGQGGKGGDGTVIIGNQQPTSAKEEPKVDVEQIKRLIRDLDADDITIRDKATEELKKIGKPALTLLEESVKSDSPEVAWRSKIIINAIKKTEQQKEPQDDSASNKIGSTLRRFGNNFNITIKGATPGTKSFAMSQDASGKINVTITEYDKDGKQNTKTYEANSPEEFKQKYPEVAKEYGIGENPSVTIEIPDFDFEDIWKDFGKSWGRQWQDLQEEMDRLRNMFNRRQGNRLPNKIESEDEENLPEETSALSGTDLGVSFGEADDLSASRTQQAGKLLVNNVEPNGLGAQIGLKKGDVILSVNGAAVDNLWQCRRQIKAALAKGRVSLVVIRENKKETLNYPK